MEREYRLDFMLKPSVSNAERQLPLTLLIEQVIELATDHANHLGIGFLSMEGKDIGWVLSRLSVEMKRWPKVGEKYTVKTWVETWNRHFSERCFAVEEPDGKVLGYVRTVWMVIGLTSHKSYGTAEMHLPEDVVGVRECPILRQQRHKHFEPSIVTEYMFKYTDIDFYRHVNTVRYAALMLNQFSLEMFDKHHLYRFEIAFMHEAKFGEKAIINGIKEDVELVPFPSDPSVDSPCPIKTESFTYEMKVNDNPIVRSRLFFIKN